MNNTPLTLMYCIVVIGNSSFFLPTYLVSRFVLFARTTVEAKRIRLRLWLSFLPLGVRRACLWRLSMHPLSIFNCPFNHEHELILRPIKKNPLWDIFFGCESFLLWVLTPQKQRTNRSFAIRWCTWKEIDLYNSAGRSNFKFTIDNKYSSHSFLLSIDHSHLPAYTAINQNNFTSRCLHPEQSLDYPQTQPIAPNQSSAVSSPPRNPSRKPPPMPPKKLLK